MSVQEEIAEPEGGMRWLSLGGQRWTRLRQVHGLLRAGGSHLTFQGGEQLNWQRL